MRSITKSIARFKLLGIVLLTIAIGLKLVSDSSDRESETMRGYDLYDAAVTALGNGDTKSAYQLFLQASYAFTDPDMQALAMYEAANVGWVGRIADYETLVNLYKQAIRYRPGFYEASFNLEYLYWLRIHNPDQIPQPKSGDKSDEPEPGHKPGQGGAPTYGDI